MADFQYALRRIFLCKLLLRLPHALICHILDWWALLEQKFATRRFRLHHSGMQWILPHGTECELNHLARRSLACNALKPWRLLALEAASEAEFAEQVSVQGLEFLREQVQAGRGVIVLNCHVTAGHIVPLVLDRLGFRGIVSMGRGDYFSNTHCQAATRLRILDLEAVGVRFLRQLYAAKQALLQGALLHIAGDGRQGQSGVVVPFLHFHRRMAKGFAELALATGAAVIPVLAVVTECGPIQVTFHAPLEAGPAGQTAAARVDALVRQYGRLVEQYWLTYPENFTPQWIAYMRQELEDNLSATVEEVKR